MSHDISEALDNEVNDLMAAQAKKPSPGTINNSDEN